MEEKTEIQLYVESTLRELLDAAKEGIATLIADVRRPIADDVADERRKSALESKKRAFMDAQEMMTALVRLDNQMRGEVENEDNNKDGNFQGGAAEKFAQKK
tara:strand:- start:140 stop:445 length:306 start_codon:yes stop_codon:yes gene_type:complete